MCPAAAFPFGMHPGNEVTGLLQLPEELLDLAVGLAVHSLNAIHVLLPGHGSHLRMSPDGMVRSPPLVAELESGMGSLIRWRSARACRICLTRVCGVNRVISGSPSLARTLIAPAMSASYISPLAQ